jgi:hypothetical protein
MTTLGSLKNLAQKMINIMQEVAYIPKTGFNAFHKYRYTTEADVSTALSKALIKHKVFMFSSVLERESKIYQTRTNKEAFLITVKLALTFIDVESGESFTGIFFGDGSDPDDKGLYKAMTGAQKYALMKTFLVATGSDPEQETDAYRTAVHLTELLASLENKAKQGSAVFRGAWRNLSSKQRLAIRHQMPELQKLAIEADQSLPKTQIYSSDFKE